MVQIRACERRRVFFYWPRQPTLLSKRATTRKADCQAT